MTITVRISMLEHAWHAPLLGVCGGGVAALLAGVVVHRGAPAETGLFAAIVFLMVAAGTITPHIALRRRLLRHVREHDSLLCTECRQPLTGLASAGQCPECGTSFVHDECAAVWRRAIEAPRLFRRETWRAQFSGPYMSQQRSFDLIAAFILPITCFALDPVVFRGNGLAPAILGDWWWAGHVGLVIMLVLFSAWMAISRPLNPGSVHMAAQGGSVEPTAATSHLRFVIGGGLLAAAAASMVIGVVLLPISLIGLIVIFGVLGFSPWFTAFALARSGVRCLHGMRHTSQSARRSALAAMGAGAVLSVPLLIQFRADSVVDEVIRTVVLPRSQSEIDSAVDRAKFFTRVNPVSLDDLVQHWMYEADSAQAERIRAAYRSLTGQDIFRRADFLEWQD